LLIKATLSDETNKSFSAGFGGALKIFKVTELEATTVGRYSNTQGMRWKPKVHVILKLTGVGKPG